MLSGKEKAAIFLAVLGPSYSESILDNLPHDVSDAIASVLSRQRKKATPEEILQVIAEFNEFMAGAQKMKEDRARIAEQEASAPPLEIISKAPPAKIAMALNGERPEFMAYVLSHLPVERIYDILSLLGAARKDVEEKLVNMKDVPMAQVFQEEVLDIVAKRLQAM